MAQDQPKDWRQLCEAASKEEDPDKLMALVAQINIALDDESERRRNCGLWDERDRVGECAA